MQKRNLQDVIDEICQRFHGERSVEEVAQAIDRELERDPDLREQAVRRAVHEQVTACLISKWSERLNSLEPGSEAANQVYREAFDAGLHEELGARMRVEGEALNRDADAIQRYHHARSNPH